jgi:tol-pal system protein YbgF
MTNPRILSRFRLFTACSLSAALLFAGCAASAPDTASRDADLAETLKLAQEARLELQTQSARLGELEGQVRDLTEMLAWSAERDATQDRALDSLRRGGKGSAASPASAARPVAAAPSSMSAVNTVTKSVKPEEATLYRSALDLYFARQYAPAITAFQDLLTRWPKGAYADNATYWIGESQYGLGEHAAALASFQLVLTSYPKSAKADDAQLKLGYCHLKLGDTRRAGEEFRKLVSLHPSSEYVERARGELAKLGTP